MWRPRDRERFIGSYDPEREMPDPDRGPGDRWQSDAYRHNARDSRFAYRFNPDRIEERFEGRRDFDRERNLRWQGDGRDRERERPPYGSGGYSREDRESYGGGGYCRRCGDSLDDYRGGQSWEPRGSYYSDYDRGDHDRGGPSWSGYGRDTDRGGWGRDERSWSGYGDDRYDRERNDRWRR